MVALPSNMFSTVTLPATLWFLINKTKENEILFIDARNIFTQVDRVLRKLSDEQIKIYPLLQDYTKMILVVSMHLLKSTKKIEITLKRKKRKNTFNNKLIGC